MTLSRLLHLAQSAGRSEMSDRPNLVILTEREESLSWERPGNLFESTSPVATKTEERGTMDTDPSYPAVVPAT